MKQLIYVGHGLCTRGQSFVRGSEKDHVTNFKLSNNQEFNPFKIKQ